MPFVVVSAGAATDHSADAKVRRPRRELNSAAQGIRTIIRSPVRNLQQDDEDDRENAPYLSACIGRYPGYNLELGAWVNPNGHVRTIYLQDGGASGTEMLFEFDVYENEDHCKDCRIHIVTGTTCEDADEVGGHYWNSDVISEDPWTRRNGAFYNSNNNGKAIGAFEVDNGYSYEENLGHAVVIYAMDGRTKIGCGILEDGDQGMHCDPFADGSGERDDGGDDDSSDVEDESEISQDVQSEISPSRPSSPSSPSASAPSPRLRRHLTVATCLLIMAIDRMMLEQMLRRSTIPQEELEVEEDITMTLMKKNQRMSPRSLKKVILQRRNMASHQKRAKVRQRKPRAPRAARGIVLAATTQDIQRKRRWRVNHRSTCPRATRASKSR